MASMGELTARVVLGGMDAVERQLKAFSRQMNNVGKQLNNMGKTMQDAGQSFNEVGQNLAPLSAGLVALGGASVVASENISSAMNNFKTKLGASGDELENYQNIMYEVASTGVGSFDEVSNAVVTLSKNMKGLDNDELTMLTEEAMQLANVMESDVSEVSKVAGQLMKQFGVNGATAMDLIAKGYQNGMDYAGDYLDTLNEYSVYFKTLGFDAEEMFNVLISGAEAGAFNLDKVGDAVKEFGIRAKDGSDTSKEAFEALGMNAEKMTSIFAKGGEDAQKAYVEVVNQLAKVDDQTKRNAIGVSLFGTQYEDMEKDVIASTASMTDHMKGVEGASAELAQNNKTFAQEMQGYWNDIQVAIKPVGDIIKDFVSSVIPPLVEGIKSLAQGFTGLSPTMQKVILGFGAFVAILPVLLMGIGGFLSVLGTVTKGFGMLSKAGTKLIGSIKKIGAAFKVLSRLFLANPFMLIVTGIIVVAVLIYKYWDEITAVTKAVWEGIKSFFSGIWDGIKNIVKIAIEGFKAYFERIKDFWTGVWNACVSFLQSVWDVIKNVLLIAVGIVASLFMPIYNAFASVWNAVVSFLQVAIGWIKEKIGAMVDWIKGAWNKVKEFATTAWNAIYNSVIVPVVNKIKSFVTTLINTVTSIMNKIKSAFKTAWDFVYNNIVKPVIDKVKNIINTVTTKVTEVTDKVKSTFTSAFNTVKDKVTASIDKVIDKITGIWTKAKDVADKITGAFSNIFKGIKVPSFSMGGWKPSDLPKLPKMSIKWHAKGGILDSSTLIGAGEKGAESIVPLSSQRRMKPFAMAVSKFMPENAKKGNGNTTIQVSQLVVREEADIQKVAQELNRLQDRKSRARGGLVYG